MHILVVEDDPFIAKAMTAALQEQSHTVSYAADVAQAMAILSVRTPDAILLDLGLPRLDGLSLLRTIRHSSASLVDVPVLIVTARDSLESRLQGLDAGADDYIVKPFHMSELLARLRAVMRRKGPLAESVMHFDDLTLNMQMHCCRVDSKEVDLTRREFALLAALMQRPGAILSKRMLEELIYNPGEEPESNAIEFLLYSLRRKIGAHRIGNIRGLGWRLLKSDPEGTELCN